MTLEEQVILLIAEIKQLRNIISKLEKSEIEQGIHIL